MIESELNMIDDVTLMHARFYELSSNLYKAIGNHSGYLKSSLRYLNSIKNESLSGNILIFWSIFTSKVRL